MCSHKWVEDGGQPCPHNVVLEPATIIRLKTGGYGFKDAVYCYRPYYVCEICGENDYGKISLAGCNKCKLKEKGENA